MPGVPPAGQGACTAASASALNACVTAMERVLDRADADDELARSLSAGWGAMDVGGGV